MLDNDNIPPLTPFNRFTMLEGPPGVFNVRDRATGDTFKHSNRVVINQWIGSRAPLMTETRITVLRNEVVALRNELAALKEALTALGEHVEQPRRANVARRLGYAGMKPDDAPRSAHGAPENDQNDDTVD